MFVYYCVDNWARMMFGDRAIMLFIRSAAHINKKGIWVIICNKLKAENER